MSRPDLRLVPPALGMWVATLVGLRVPALAAGGTALALAVAAALIARRTAQRRLAIDGLPIASRAQRAARLRARRRVWLRWVAVALLLGAIGGLLATAARTWARDSPPLAGLAQVHATVRAELVITGDPHALRSAGVGRTTYLVPARLERLETSAVSATVDARVLIFGTDAAWRVLLPSERIRVEGRLAPPRGGDLTAATVTAVDAPQRLAPPSWAQRAAGRLRAGLQAACAGLASEPGGLLPGLVIGDTSRLDPALAEEFRIAGLTHLTAVSGANLAIVVGVVLFAARWCRAGPWLGAGICAVGLVGFVILARPSPSVVRAAAMAAIGLLALASGRSRAAAPALATAVMASLVVDPALAVDPGFALSVCATGALVLLAPRWCEALRSRGWPAWLAAAVAGSAAAQVVCGPIVAALSGGVSLIAIPANLLAAVAVAPATLLGVGAAIVSALWPDGAAALAWLASCPALWLVAIAHAGAGVPTATVPWPAGLIGALLLALSTAAVWTSLRWPPLRRYVLVAALAVAAGTAPVRLFAPGWPPAGALVVACDVGQGDALVLPVSDEAAVVVDTGPEPALVDACLGRLGVTRVVLLVITHFHADHVGGIRGVLRHRVVDAVVVPDFGEPVAGRAAVDEAAAGLALRVVSPGWTFSLGGLRLAVIGPATRHVGTRSDPNNNSLVLRADRGSTSILLTGDAEVEEQHDLLALGAGALRADVLKVAHHGSAYQDESFLAQVAPAVALVSVGAGNPYGHPNTALLRRLEGAGVFVARTDIAGDVAVLATADGIGVVARGPPGTGLGDQRFATVIAPLLVRRSRWYGPSGSFATLIFVWPELTFVSTR